MEGERPLDRGVPEKRRPGASDVRWKAHVEASEAAAAPRLVPVVLNSTRARGVAGEPFVVELGDDLRIRVAAGFDADELARLVEVLAGCRC